MNEKKAKKILKVQKPDEVWCIYCASWEAQGYLEGLNQGRAEIIEKAKRLVGVLDRISLYHSMEGTLARKALAQWEKEV